MDNELLKMENVLKNKSNKSAEDLLEYILFEMSPLIEDYYLVIELLEDKYSEIYDVRLAIIGSYLSSTWLGFKENVFLKKLEDLKEYCSEQDKAIVCYLHAYDIYVKNDRNFPPQYVSYLKKSISYSNRFVYNYVRLSEVSQGKKAQTLLKQAISNIEKVWSEDELHEIPKDYIGTYDDFVNEYILGVDISKNEYEQLCKKVNYAIRLECGERKSY